MRQYRFEKKKIFVSAVEVVLTETRRIPFEWEGGRPDEEVFVRWQCPVEVTSPLYLSDEDWGGDFPLSGTHWLEEEFQLRKVLRTLKKLYESRHGYDMQSWSGCIVEPQKVILIDKIRRPSLHREVLLNDLLAELDQKFEQEEREIREYDERCREDGMI